MIMIDQKKMVQRRKARALAREIVLGAAVILLAGFCLSETYLGWFPALSQTVAEVSK